MIEKKTRNNDKEALYRKLIGTCAKLELHAQAQNALQWVRRHGIRLEGGALNSYRQAQTPTAPPDATIDLDFCYFSTEDHCSSCSTALLEEDLMIGWERSYSAHTTTCPKCEVKFLPSFTVHTPSAEPLKLKLLSPLILQGQVEASQKLPCAADSTLYWNLFLYFKLLQLPYFFLSPGLSPEILPLHKGKLASTQNKQLLRSCTIEFYLNSTLSIPKEGPEYKNSEFFRSNSITSSWSGGKSCHSGLSDKPHINEFRVDNGKNVHTTNSEQNTA